MRAALLILIAAALQATEVRIGVLELFHAKTLRLRASAIAIGGERLQLHDEAEIALLGDSVICHIGGRELRGSRLAADGPLLRLSVPGKLERSYRGALEVTAAKGELHPVITMDLEDAVSSTVAAEMPGGPGEALKAQAIAARSYFRAARGRHTAFDFCDTTHCQWVQGAQPASNPSTNAAKETSGVTLQVQGRILDAMYFRSCSGRTLRAADVKLDPSGYPYFAMDCQACRRQPYLWESRLPLSDTGELLARGPSEHLRLQLARRFGWNLLPSNTYTAETAGNMVVFHGKGEGHGVGMCQHGALAMAKSGAAAAAILLHYYPATVIR